MKRIFAVYVLIVLFLCLSGCVSSQSDQVPADTSSPVVYNKFNIHYHYKNSSDMKAHCANWTGPYPGHKFLPPNTPVKIQPWSRGFIIIREDNGQKIRFTYSTKFMTMNQQDYVDTLFSPVKISLAGMSAQDRKGIEQGKALLGMTKKGIMTALGYPVQHTTPSPDAQEWTYWTNRFGKRSIYFDQNAKVNRIIE